MFCVRLSWSLSAFECILHSCILYACHHTVSCLSGMMNVVGRQVLVLHSITAQVYY